MVDVVREVDTFVKAPVNEEVYRTHGIYSTTKTSSGVAI